MSQQRNLAYITLQNNSLCDSISDTSFTSLPLPSDITQQKNELLP